MRVTSTSLETRVATGAAADRRLYDDWHSRYAVDIDADAPWHCLVKANLSETDLASKTILEIGCGRGGFSCWLARQVFKPRRIVATDFSPAAIEKGKNAAQGLNLGGIEWRVGDIQAIAHPDASFDTVVSCETIEHVPDPRRALAELVRVLKPGGRLFLTSPNYFGLMGLYRIYCGLRGRTFTEEGQPINQFLLLPRTRHWVRSAGLRISSSTSLGFYLPRPGRPMLPMPYLERWAGLRYWFGLHSLIVAEKSIDCIE
ncbi:MAG TPA: class I SAM-dependent methyltransferase [Bryobacteraceae bacterium]|jgi:2-polyprenyl-3-methyl-5-hydroxy-6-metoxy-1,4-benzoquinol methylase